MSNFLFDQEAYLKRIKFQGKVKIDFDSLKAIHEAQHKTIPFENFDICLGKSIQLNPEALSEKLIHNRRGGYCFELNGLLLLALQSFGFQARALLGRVHISGEPTGRGHQITLVTTKDKQWIVDLGLGSNSPLIPIAMTPNKIVSYYNKTYRIQESELFGYMLQSKINNEWVNLYSFELSHVCKGDIDYGNHYTSTGSSSFFISSRVAVIRVDNDMVALLNFNLKKTTHGKEQNTTIREGQPYLDMLQKEFNIVLNTNYNNLKALEL